MKNKEITQFSTINALMSGVFDGFVSVDQIISNGEFGLGCSDGLEGELIIHKSVLMEAKGIDQARVMDGKELIPFAQVTSFNPDETFDAENVSKNNLYEILAKHTLLDNVFLAVQLSGVFDQLKIRTPDTRGNRYKDASELAKNEIVRDYSLIEGTLIGFWTPKFFENLSVAGFHVHFINKDKTIGGHVLEFSIAKAKVAYEVKDQLKIELPSSDDYLKKDLDIDDMSSIIKKVEN